MCVCLSPSLQIAVFVCVYVLHSFKHPMLHQSCLNRTRLSCTVVTSWPEFPRIRSFSIFLDHLLYQSVRRWNWERPSERGRGCLFVPTARRGPFWMQNMVTRWLGLKASIPRSRLYILFIFQYYGFGLALKACTWLVAPPSDSESNQSILIPP